MEVSFFYHSNMIFCLMLGHEFGHLKSLNPHSPWTKPRQHWFTMCGWHCYEEVSCFLPNLVNLDCSNLQELKNFLFLKIFEHFCLKCIKWRVTRIAGVSLNRSSNQRHCKNLEHIAYCWSGTPKEGRWGMERGQRGKIGGGKGGSRG